MVEWLKWYIVERVFQRRLKYLILRVKNSGRVVEVVGSGERGFHRSLYILYQRGEFSG